MIKENYCCDLGRKEGKYKRTFLRGFQIKIMVPLPGPKIAASGKMEREGCDGWFSSPVCFQRCFVTVVFILWNSEPFVSITHFKWTELSQKVGNLQIEVYYSYSNHPGFFIPVCVCLLFSLVFMNPQEEKCQCGGRWEGKLAPVPLLNG